MVNKDLSRFLLEKRVLAISLRRYIKILVVPGNYPSLFRHLKEYPTVTAIYPSPESIIRHFSDTWKNCPTQKEISTISYTHRHYLPVTWKYYRHFSNTWKNCPKCRRHLSVTESIIRHLSDTRKKTRKIFMYPFRREIANNLFKKLERLFCTLHHTSNRSFSWRERFLWTWAKARIFLFSNC